MQLGKFHTQEWLQPLKYRYQRMSMLIFRVKAWPSISTEKQVKSLELLVEEVARSLQLCECHCLVWVQLFSKLQ
jgi:hypothetical protein